MLSRGILVLALVASALAAPAADTQCPRTVCVDAINSCGVRYGACYDGCSPELRPMAPPCSTASLSTSTDDCSTRTVCADYVNECGQAYGGCFSACTPWPTFSKPPCTSTASVATPVTTPVPVVTPPSSNSPDCHSQTVCADYVNECGQAYGGCFSACTPWPTFTAPPCTTTMTSVPTTTTSPSSTSCESGTICRDYLKTCSGGEILTYGG